MDVMPIAGRQKHRICPFMLFLSICRSKDEAKASKSFSPDAFCQGLLNSMEAMESDENEDEDDSLELPQTPGSDLGVNKVAV